MKNVTVSCLLTYNTFAFQFVTSRSNGNYFVIVDILLPGIIYIHFSHKIY